MLFILDGSNSMWGRVEGQAKIKTAQDVLASLMADLPKDTKVGLMVYGHRSKVSCDDIELLSPIGADGPAKLVEKIRSIQPTGKTPIANALFGSLIAFSKFEGQNNHVVLISDGIETCGGDVCMAASAIANANIKPRVHVVGFDVGAKERAQLECIPKMGNGKYFSAANAGELKTAIAQVKQVAEAAPQPKKPKKPKKKGPKEVFRDDFKGEELADHWEVVNPDPDAFIVEDGGLLILSGSTGDRAKLNFPNLFKLADAMPKGDWVVTAKFNIALQTGLEVAYIGLVNHPNDALYVTMTSYMGNSGYLNLNGVKRSKGKETNTSRQLFKIDYPGRSTFGAVMKNIPQPIFLRLQKKGRGYVGSIKFSEDKKAKWTALDKLTVLRQKGKLVFGLYQSKKTKGESTMTVDWVKIEVPEE
ncbi:MAG: VWA domain-containing protein [Rhodospirillales bacterium]